ncbi:hypothetical protein [uncultured Sphingomonas sp.]|uniref:hypothetical protein n=1 Tax=uncultured Sphingomonas sp. TaxID=158754 RepID=UPI0035CC8EDF
MNDDENFMVGEERSIDLNISDHYFRLTTEGVRLHSNLEGRYTSLSDIVNDRARLACSIVKAYEVDDLRKHLHFIPADGDVSIKLTILENSAESIEHAIPQLTEALGSSVRFGEAVSLLLFDWIAERHSTEIVMKLGLSAEEAELYSQSFRRRRK